MRRIVRWPWRDPEPGKLHKIGSAGEGIGPKECPHDIYSWEGPKNGPTTKNGGGRRPALNWRMSKSGEIGDTRLTVPAETVATQSMPSWHYQLVREEDQSHEFTWLCYNNGIPARTATAVDQCVMMVLIMFKVKIENRLLASAVARQLRIQ